jgi:hypothetical protein
MNGPCTRAELPPAPTADRRWAIDGGPAGSACQHRQRRPAARASSTPRRATGPARWGPARRPDHHGDGGQRCKQQSSRGHKGQRPAGPASPAPTGPPPPRVNPSTAGSAGFRGLWIGDRWRRQTPQKAAPRPGLRQRHQGQCGRSGRAWPAPCKHSQFDRQRQDQPDQRPRIDARAVPRWMQAASSRAPRQPQRRGHAQHHGQCRRPGIGCGPTTPARPTLPSTSPTAGLWRTLRLCHSSRACAGAASGRRGQQAQGPPGRGATQWPRCGPISHRWRRTGPRWARRATASCSRLSKQAVEQARLQVGFGPDRPGFRRHLAR